MEGLHRIDDEGAFRMNLVLAKQLGSETGSTARSLVIGLRICSRSETIRASPTYLPWKPCSGDMTPELY